MKRMRIGDVFAIDTPKGEAYLQFVHRDEHRVDLIRVLPGLYPGESKDLSPLVAGKELFFVKFPLGAAFNRKIVRLVGNFPLPEGFELPKKMRSGFVDRSGRRTHWHIVECETWHRESVTELSPEQQKLSPWGIWNDTYLVERLVEGWCPEKWV